MNWPQRSHLTSNWNTDYRRVHGIREEKEADRQARKEEQEENRKMRLAISASNRSSSSSSTSKKDDETIRLSHNGKTIDVKKKDAGTLARTIYNERRAAIEEKLKSTTDIFEQEAIQKQLENLDKEYSNLKDQAEYVSKFFEDSPSAIAALFGSDEEEEE